MGRQTPLAANLDLGAQRNNPLHAVAPSLAAGILPESSPTAPPPRRHNNNPPRSATSSQGWKSRNAPTVSHLSPNAPSFVTPLTPSDVSHNTLTSKQRSLEISALAKIERVKSVQMCAGNDRYCLVALEPEGFYEGVYEVEVSASFS